MSDKVKAIVAHITLIGWLIALILSMTQGKTPLTTFYLRQLLGLIAIGLVSGFFPSLIGTIISLLVIAAWVYSLIGAVKEERRELPWVGEYFQKWFDFI
jgi:uncharacterized membrane protein